MSSDQHAPALPTSITAGRHSAAGTDLHQGDHAFDDAPVSALPDDEPRTPGWLPAVGLALFLVALVFVLASGDESPRKDTPSREPPSAAIERPAVAPPIAATALASAGTKPRRTPEQMEEIKKLLEGRAKAGQPPPGGRPAAPPSPPHDDD